MGADGQRGEWRNTEALTLTANGTGNNAFPSFSSDGSEVHQSFHLIIRIPHDPDAAPTAAQTPADLQAGQYIAKCCCAVLGCLQSAMTLVLLLIMVSLACDSKLTYLIKCR